MGTTDGTGIWSLHVTAIGTEAIDTKTIFLRREDGGPFPYKAGQFLTFLFSPNGREMRRSYSFCTTPGVDPLPGITVKRVANGEISRYLLDHLRVGDTVKSLPPSGRFFLEEMADTHFFLAAGSGIVPVYSLLKQALRSSPAASVVLVSQQHDRASAPFYDALQALSGLHGHSRFQWIDLLTIRDGRLNNWGLEKWLFSLLPREAFPGTRFYICGPPAFMRMAQFTLRTLGIPETHLKQEHFTVERRPLPPPAMDPGPKKVLLHSSMGDRAFAVVWPDTILQAAEKHGIALPYSCRAGRCSTCVARLLQGRVKMSNNEVLTDNDVQEGLVLTCVGYPETDVELSFSSQARTL